MSLNISGKICIVRPGGTKRQEAEAEVAELKMLWKEGPNVQEAMEEEQIQKLKPCGGRCSRDKST